MMQTHRFASDTANLPLHIVLNTGSGKQNTDELRAVIERMMADAGRAYKLFMVERGKPVDVAARNAVDAAKSSGGAVVAAGGDGTVSAVARATLGSGCPFGILPQGTFNYFGRAQGIPQDAVEAVAALLAARIEPVQVGLVNDRAFLVNASLGLHPQMLEDREAFTRQFGRSRWVAIWASITTLFKYHRQLRISLEIQGRTHEICTPTLFVCNNSLQLEQIGIPLLRRLEQGQLAAFMLRPVGTLAMLWLLIRGAIGRLGEARNVINFAFETMTVRPAGIYGRRRIKVAMDGETEAFYPPLVFRISPEPIYLMKPHSSAGTEADVSDSSLKT